MELLKEKSLAEIPPIEEERVIVIDLMGYAWEVAMIKLKLKRIHDLVKNMGLTFQPLILF